MTENPLKPLSNEELVSFSEELDRYMDIMYKIYDSYADSAGGILNPYGLSILRALYVCVIRLYMDKKILTPEDIAQGRGFRLDLGEFGADMENFSNGSYDPGDVESWGEETDEFYDFFSNQYFGEIGMGDDISDLSSLDGIGDFKEFWLDPGYVYDVYFGSDDESEEDAEDAVEKEYEYPEFFEKYFEEVQDSYENYFSEVSSFSVTRSEKLGKAVALLKEKGYEEKKVQKHPLVNLFLERIQTVCSRNLWYMSEFNGYIIDEDSGEWFGYTLTSGTCDDQKSITIYQRLPGVRGYAFLVQEMADRILDGRIQC